MSWKLYEYISRITIIIILYANIYDKQCFCYKISNIYKTSFQAQAFLTNQIPFNKISRAGITINKDILLNKDISFEDIINNWNVNIISVNLMNSSSEDIITTLDILFNQLNDYYRNNSNFIIIDLIANTNTITTMKSNDTNMMGNTNNIIDTNMENKILNILKKYTYVHIINSTEYNNIGRILPSIYNLNNTKKNTIIITKTINMNDIQEYNIIIKSNIFQQYQPNAINIMNDPIDWTKFLFINQLDLTDYDQNNNNTNLCKIQIQNTTYQLDQELPFLFAQSNNTIINPNLEIYAFLCGANIIRQINQENLEQINWKTFLFVHIVSELKDNNKIYCFKAKKEENNNNMLSLLPISDCNSIVAKNPLCRDLKSNELFLGLPFKQIIPFNEPYCPKGAILTTPKTYKEANVAITLMNTYNTDEIWISLLANKLSSNNLIWEELISNTMIMDSNNNDQGLLQKFIKSEYIYIYIITILIFSLFVLFILFKYLIKLRRKKEHIEQNQDHKRLVIINDEDITSRDNQRELKFNNKRDRDRNLKRDKTFRKERKPIELDKNKKHHHQQNHNHNHGHNSSHNHRYISENTFNNKEFQSTNQLKLDEFQHFAIVDNENILTHIDNSPDSNIESCQSSIRVTPKDVDFHVEFSIMDQDGKIKTSREGYENDNENEIEEEEELENQEDDS